MWSAPALGSEKEIIRIELIHALEVGLQNRCGVLLMALIINQTKPPATTLPRSPHGSYHRSNQTTNNIGKILSSTKPNQTTNNIGKIHLEVLVTNADDDDRHWEARCGDHGTLSVVNHDGGDLADKIRAPHLGLF